MPIKSTMIYTSSNCDFFLFFKKNYKYLVLCTLVSVLASFFYSQYYVDQKFESTILIKIPILEIDYSNRTVIEFIAAENFYSHNPCKISIAAKKISNMSMIVLRTASKNQKMISDCTQEEIERIDWINQVSSEEIAARLQSFEAEAKKYKAVGFDVINFIVTTREKLEYLKKNKSIKILKRSTKEIHSRLILLPATLIGLFVGCLICLSKNNK